MSGGVIWTDDVNGLRVVLLYLAEFLTLGNIVLPVMVLGVHMHAWRETR
jgi:hypothetical protein